MGRAVATLLRTDPVRASTLNARDPLEPDVAIGALV